MFTKLRIFGISLPVLFFFLTGCDRNKDILSNGVVMSAESVNVGERVPVHFQIDGYRGRVEMSMLVQSFDVVCQCAENISGYSVERSSGELILSPASIDIPESGRLDFFIAGLDAGTYRFSAFLGIGSASVYKNAVFVVKSNGSGEGQERIVVDDFTLPVLDGETGKLKLMVGESYGYVPEIKPVGIKDVVFWAMSSNNDIATATVSPSGTVIVIEAAREGTCEITVGMENADGPRKTFGVVVFKDSGGGDKYISDFTIPQPDLTYGAVCIQGGTDYYFRPQVVPAEVSGVEFDVVSTNTGVAMVNIDNGLITISGVQPGRCNVIITPSNAVGPTKTIPLIVYQEIVVKIDFQENTATASEIRNKTFPCNMRFSAVPAVSFDSPIVFTVAGKATVSKSGHNTQSVNYKKEISFRGNKTSLFDVTENVLIPAWEVFRSEDFNLRITMSIVYESSLDPALWRLTYDEEWKSQVGVRIRDYITDDLQ